MVSPQIKTQVLHYYHQQGWSPGTIASQLNIDRSSVLLILKNDGVVMDRKPKKRNTDEYLPFIQAKLAEFPNC